MSVQFIVSKKRFTALLRQALRNELGKQPNADIVAKLADKYYPKIVLELCGASESQPEDGKWHCGCGKPQPEGIIYCPECQP